MAKSISQTVMEGTTWLFSSTILVKLIGIASIFLVLHNLSVYEYGVVELTLSVLPLFSFFLLPGLNSVIVADMAIAKNEGSYGKAGGIFIAYGKIYISLAIMAWTILFFGSELIATLYDEHFASFFKIVSFLLLISPVRALCSVFFNFALRFREQYLIGVFEEVFRFAGILILVVYLDMGITGMLFAIIFSQIIALLILAPYCYFNYRAMFQNYPTQSISSIVLLRSHRKWSIASSYIGSATQSIRLYIIKIFLGTEAVALFAVALGLFNHVLSLVSLHAIIGPMLAHYVQDIKRFTLLLIKGIKYQFVAFLSIALVAFIGLPFLISELFPQYTESIFILNILLLILIPASADTFFSYVFASFQAQRSQFFASAYKAILTIVILPPMLIYFGLLGAGLTLLIVTIFYDLERYRALRHLLPFFKITLRDIFGFDEADRQIIHRLRSVFIK